MYLRFDFATYLKVQIIICSVLFKHMYSTVTTKHFILKLISFPAKIWHVTLHLLTPPLVYNDSLDSFKHSQMHDF